MQLQKTHVVTSNQIKSTRSEQCNVTMLIVSFCITFLSSCAVWVRTPVIMTTEGTMTMVVIVERPLVVHAPGVAPSTALFFVSWMILQASRYQMRLRKAMARACCYFVQLLFGSFLIANDSNAINQSRWKSAGTPNESNRGSNIAFWLHQTSRPTSSNDLVVRRVDHTPGWSCPYMLFEYESTTNLMSLPMPSSIRM